MSSATHSYQCVQYTVCPNSGMAASAWDFNVHTDVDACDCIRGLYGHRARVYLDWQLMTERKIPSCTGTHSRCKHIAGSIHKRSFEPFICLDLVLER